MELKIRFDVDNDAFGKRPEIESSRLLRGIAAGLEERGLFNEALHNRPIILRDFNGNKIGFFTVDSWKRSNV